VVEDKLIPKLVGWVIAIDAVAVQPLLSVAVIVYVPALTVAVILLPPAGDQAYV
jgi:hypothetical protein